MIDSMSRARAIDFPKVSRVIARRECRNHLPANCRTHAESAQKTKRSAQRKIAQRRNLLRTRKNRLAPFSLLVLVASREPPESR